MTAQRYRTAEYRERDRIAKAARRAAGHVRTKPIPDPDDYSHPDSDVSRGA